MTLSNYFEYAKNLILRTREDENVKNRQYYASIYGKMNISPNTILIEVRDGKSLTDSPLRIMLELLKRDESKYEFRVVHDGKNLAKFRLELDYWLQKFGVSQAKIDFILRNSKKYQQALLTSEWIITNSTLQEYHVKQPNQKIVNTWHGTPIKFMGFKIKNSLADSKNVLRNFLQADYLLSPSPFFTRVLKEDYRLEGLYSGKIIEAGYPRNDVLEEDFRQDAIELLSKSFQMKWDVEKKNMMYTPTWKGTDVNDSDSSTESLYQEYKRLHNEFSNEYNVFIKVHPFDYESAKGDARLQQALIPDEIDANVVLSMTDLLITDYSSIFFDYLKMNKPLVFYGWDEDLYTEERGLYIDTKTLPGKIAHDMDELVSYVKDIDGWQQEFRERLQDFQSTYLPKEDGLATQRVVSYIFEGKLEDKTEIIKVDAKEKIKLLIYAGGLRPNGITSSAINLLKNLDKDKYDISLLTTMPNRFNTESLQSVPDYVRLIFRFGEGIYTLKESLKDRWSYTVSLKTAKVLRESYYQREVDRVLAKQKFDVAIDFSGYSFFFAKFILLAHARKRIVFQHNDMWSDANREVNGEKTMLNDVLGLLDVYDEFDEIVSVSPSTMDLNKQNLKGKVSEKSLSKFTFARNTLDIDRILNSSDCKKENDKRLTQSNLALLQEKLPKNTSLSADFPRSTEIQRKNQEMKFIDISKIRTYQRFQDVVSNNYVEKSVSPTDCVQQVADKTEGLNHWSKINVNGIYFGWVHTGFLLPVGLKVTHYRSMSKVASVIRSLFWNVWKVNVDLKEASVENPIQVPAEYHFMVTDIKGQHVRILGEVQTNNGVYYHIQTLMEDHAVEGLVFSTALSNIHNLRTLNNPLWKKFEKANAKKKINRAFIPKKYEDDCYQYCVEYNGQPLFRGEKEVESILVKGVKYPIRKLFVDTSDIIYGNVVVSDKNQGWIQIKDQKDLHNVQNIEEERFTTPYKEVFPMLKKSEDHFVREEGKVYFVSMARLSPEKNQLALIQATSELVQEGIANIQVDILGQGPLRKTLEDAIEEYNLQGIVNLLGQKEFPFDYLKERDVFILPSLWEGQPMVLLESLTLGVHTVSSNIPSSSYVLQNHGKTYGLISEGTTVGDIKELMKKAMNKEQFANLDEFDVEQYNSEAIDEFVSILS